MRRFLAAALTVLVPIVVSGTAHARVPPNCTGNHVVDHAPYTCTDTKVISGITFDITLNVDLAGKATVDYVMTPVQPADVPIAVHSYTDISAGPKQFINGTIPAGQTTGQLVVPKTECGQLDMKAVFTTPGDASGNIAGPVVTWGFVCQALATTTATTTTTTTTTSVSPASVSPTSAQQTSSLPRTGGTGVAPLTLAVPVLGVAALLIFVSRRRRPA